VFLRLRHAVEGLALLGALGAAASPFALPPPATNPSNSSVHEPVACPARSGAVASGAPGPCASLICKHTAAISVPHNRPADERIGSRYIRHLCTFPTYTCHLAPTMKDPERSVLAIRTGCVECSVSRSESTFHCSEPIHHHSP
jgi:hypothetical protein